MFSLFLLIARAKEIDLLAQGKCIFHGKGWESVCSKLQRLPDDAHAAVGDTVWADSLYTAGISLKFTSNSNSYEIVGTKTEDNNPYPWMPLIGTSSFDLYHIDSNGYHEVGHQSYGAGTAKWNGFAKGTRNFELFFPNYQKFTALKLKIDDDSTITFTEVIHSNPKIVIYGAVNAQGQGGNRPGLSWVNWMKKTLEEEITNLAFTNAGNKLEPAVVQQIATINSKVVVLDCATALADLSESEIKNRLITACDTLRSGSGTSKSAIVIVEHAGLANHKVNTDSRNIVEKVNKASKAAYDDLIKKYTNITYVSQSDIHLNSDDFSTLTNINDIGSRKYSNCIRDTISAIFNDGKYLGYFADGKSTPRNKDSEKWWFNRLNAQIEEAKTTKARRGMLGDSITEFWGGKPLDTSAPYKNVGEEQWDDNWPGAVNFGIRSDRTFHLIYRIHNGILDNNTFDKLTCLIGINNVPGTDTRFSYKLMEGIRIVYREIKKRQPQAKVSAVGLYPAITSSCKNCYNYSLMYNPKIRRLAEDDFGYKYINPGVNLAEDEMKPILKYFLDGIHPNKEGYSYLVPDFKEALKLD